MALFPENTGNRDRFTHHRVRNSSKWFWSCNGFFHVCIVIPPKKSAKTIETLN